MTENGSHPTWRELNLVRETIDNRFDTIEADLAEIKWGINVVLENRKKNWRAWGPALASALIAGFVAGAVAITVALLS